MFQGRGEDRDAGPLTPSSRLPFRDAHERILKVLWIETRQEALAALLQLGVPDAVRLVIDKEGGLLNGGTTPNVEVTSAARLYRAASGGPQGYP